jgi:hypothetical protein
VVTQEQIIIGAEITQEANDMHQMIPMLEATKDALAQAGIEEAPREVLADTGYWNDESLALGRPGVQEIRRSLSIPSGPDLFLRDGDASGLFHCDHSGG